MFKLKYEWPMLVVLAISFGLLIYGWFNLPATIPTHWGINGNPDGYGPKEAYVLMMTVMLSTVYILMLVLPKFDPEKEQYALFQDSYRTLRFSILSVIAVLNAAVLFSGLGYQVSVSKVILLSLSIMFMVMGNLMGKIRHNYFVGIRTPWTLKDENVWNKTHRLAGKLYVAAGVISLLGLFVPDMYAFIIFMTSLFGATIWAFVYSYKEYSKTNP